LDVIDDLKKMHYCQLHGTQNISSNKILTSEKYLAVSFISVPLLKLAGVKVEVLAAPCVESLSAARSIFERL